MKFLKYFKQIFEGFLDLNKINDWEINYFNTLSHPLIRRIEERINIDEETFDLLLNKIYSSVITDSLNGDWVLYHLSLVVK